MQALADNGSQTVLTPYPTGSRQKPMFVPLKNEPGEQMKIDKQLLHIDPAYQRKLNEKHVARIVANWSWVSCGVLEVSKRPGGEKWFVIDGQHRWRAAMWLPAITDLPCIAFKLDTVKDEAISFLASNTERRMPTLSDQFRALLIAGDPIAAAMEKLATAYSREFGPPTDGQHISCVSAFANIMRDNRAATERIFPVVAELSRGRPIPARLLQGFHRLERCMPRGESLTDERWRSRVVRVGYDTIIEDIRQIALIDRKGGARSFATGLLRSINRGLRQPLVANIEVIRR